VDLILDGIREAFRIMASGDYSVWEIALRSVIVSGTATAIALLFGIAVGATLAFNEFPGRNLAFSLVNTGMGLPPVVVGLMVAIVLWRSGPLGDFRLIYTPTAMIVAQTVQMLWLVLWETKLPLLAAVMAGFGGAISEIGASIMVGGNLAGETRILTTAVVLEVSRGQFAPAIALSLILLTLIFIVNLILTTVQQQERRS